MLSKFWIYSVLNLDFAKVTLISDHHSQLRLQLQATSDQINYSTLSLLVQTCHRLLLRVLLAGVAQTNFLFYLFGWEFPKLRARIWNASGPSDHYWYL